MLNDLETFIGKKEIIFLISGLFHSTFKTHSFALFLCRIGAIVLLLICLLPQTFKKSMGAMGRKISSFLLTKYTGSYLKIFINNIIKM